MTDRTDDRTPLLEPRAAALDRSTQARHPKAKYTVFLFALIVFLLDIGSFIQGAPWQRTIEAIFCRDWYAEHDPTMPLDDIPEDRCKIPPVQGQVATLVGWDISLSQIPGLFLTIPYGIAADRIGRKPIMLIGFIGLLLGLEWMHLVAFLAQRRLMSIQWALASNAVNLFGGGSAVPVAMIYTMVSDVTTESERARAFFRVYAAAIASQIFAMPAASALMRYSPWLPMLMGSGSFLLAILISLGIPETLTFRQEAIADANKALPGGGPASTEAADGSEPPASVDMKPAQRLRALLEPFALVLRSASLAGLTAAFLVQSLGKSANGFLLNVASNRFHWSFSRANILLAVSASTTLVFLTLILPKVEQLLEAKLKIRATRANLFMARWSIVALSLGYIGIGLSGFPAMMVISVIVTALGVGFSPAVRDVATALVPAEAVARLYSMLQTVDTFGAMIAGPVLSKSFIQGEALGGTWIGLPFILAGGLYVCVAIIVWLVRLPSEDEEGGAIPQGGAHDE